MNTFFIRGITAYGFSSSRCIRGWCTDTRLIVLLSANSALADRLPHDTVVLQKPFDVERVVETSRHAISITDYRPDELPRALPNRMNGAQ
jgi:hypothetical protein